MSELNESTDVNIKAVIGTAIAILAAVAFAGTIAWFTWKHWSLAVSSDGPNSPFDFSVAQPVLASAPQTEKTEYFREKERLLNSYQWVDRQAGMARIPVEQAMQIMAQHGTKPSPEVQP
jgi:hypothetical protein